MVLHIAKEPPPIGGVTIHVQRLNQLLINVGIDSEIFDYSRKKISPSVLKKFLSASIIHLHLSNKLYRLLLTVIFRIFGKKIIITFHGKYDFKNKFDSFSLKLCTKAILLNTYSYENAKKYSDEISIVSAFIPPTMDSENSLKEETISEIEKIKSLYRHVFCTNAWNVVFDTEGKEIYGGSTLVEVFNEIEGDGIVFSDPKGAYQKFLRNKYELLPRNVLFIDYDHNFTDVLQLCDALIRATSTDGDSLSVHEALFFKKDVITTDVVNRPTGCILYSNQNQLKNIIAGFDKIKGKYKQYQYADITDELVNIYSKYY